METLEVVVTKEMISRTDYGNNTNCGICQTMRAMGYNVSSAGGSWVLVDGERYFFVVDKVMMLEQSYGDKRDGNPYGDAVVIMQAPPKPQPEPVKERTIYVTVDEKVRELQREVNTHQS
jgi:hypothetical protein